MGFSVKSVSSGRKYLIAGVITCIAMLICSAYDSPLFPLYNSSDSAIFMLIGKGITEGKLPYVDLFDHKGPVLFWIEAFGWWIVGRTGIWIVETIGAIVSVFLLIRICEQLRSNWSLPILGTAVVYLSYFGRGNLCENYSLPFILFCVFLTVRYFQSNIIKHPWKYAFAYGVCFAILAFIRVNNATVICGFVLCIIIRLAVAREYKNLIENVAAGLAGILIVTVPICLYFYMKGALQDMLFCTFTYNFMYASAQTELDGAGLIQKLITYLPIAFATVFFGIRALRGNDNRFSSAFVRSLFAVSLLCFVELLYTSMSAHYHTIALPLYSVALAMAIPDLRFSNIFTSLKTSSAKGWIAGFLLITLLYSAWSGFNACAPIYRHYLTDACVSRYQDVQECIKVIPDEERDSVVGYEIATSWYIDSGITPCYKFYSMQHWWTSGDFDVYQQFLDYVSTEHPKWLITGTNLDDEALKNELTEHYVLETEGNWAYYRYSG